MGPCRLLSELVPRPARARAGASWARAGGRAIRPPMARPPGEPCSALWPRRYAAAFMSSMQPQGPEARKLGPESLRDSLNFPVEPIRAVFVLRGG